MILENQRIRKINQCFQEIENRFHSLYICFPSLFSNQSPWIHSYFAQCTWTFLEAKYFVFVTLMALRTLERLLLMVISNRLNLPISCTRPVFILWLYEVGYFLSAASVSKLPGNFDRMSAATSSTTSSVDLPPPEDPLACNYQRDS